MIVQFGTSRFLQAHVDLFASEARDAGQAVPGIVVVQTTRDPARARRLAAFADPAGFPVIVRGMEAGHPVERTVQVRSVVGGMQAAIDWHALTMIVRNAATHIVSNTGDTGYDVAAADRIAGRADVAPASFPAMLVALLHARWAAGRSGITVLPCELVQRNASVLRDVVTGLARTQGREAAFVAWLGETCLWADTLVDRIVSSPLDPAGAIAEPYALWAIRRVPGLALPFAHPAITLTDDLVPFERLKLYILNLGHSWLAERWRQAGGAADATVRQALADPGTRGALERVMRDEIVAGFAAHGMAAAAGAYVATTLERFANPFLDHLIADIHVHHAAKVDKRVGGFVRWVDEAPGDPPAMPELRALADRVMAAA
ncbi:mannitol dehydrogenase family protein [Sphingomonas sp. KR1UV-12]|uniref:Mannitol dehydrogenase family protein n=1 Tax=Sphingomonas aurea TaxID=3063994 RepID=A0ABT9ENE6_9SPHN|nr:mannitol dehydrogenase family protein [Sphingomonas sp. KR1UV-12]MDP1028464.1 mannitol dehydrogenase family protein [Sphingomonas sp. KR1UV-12]